MLLACFLSLLAARELEVGPGKAFSTIREAIERALPGDTVTVHPGHYAGGPHLIDTSILLRGQGWPVLDGRDSAEVLTITADNVTVEGFIIRGAGQSFLRENAGIRFSRVRGGAALNNRFENNYFGIYLAESAGIHIVGNELISTAKQESRSGNGIHLWYCKNIAIENNRISHHRDGIYLEFAEDSFISKNVCSENLRYGLHFMFSDGNQYIGNLFSKNGAGVAVMFSNRIAMENNIFQENWGAASYGLLLKEIRDSRIVNNLFTDNSTGIYLESSNRLLVTDNTFRSNGWAVRIFSSAMDNRFEGNNFLDNSFDVATTGRQNFSTFSGNYWSGYRGYDLDRDGIGDVPFRPVSLFSYLVEKNEPVLILMRSLAVSLLNIAESYLPILTPETLQDDRPLMKVNP